MKDLNNLKDVSINELEKYLDRLEKTNPEKAKKIEYWVKDYVRFRNLESSFDPSKLPRYKRGQIIKVNLGFRIGSEQGGLRYAIVLDKSNNLNDSTILIAPLRSLKPKDKTKIVERKSISSLGHGMLFVGDEIYTELTEKFRVGFETLKEEQSQVQKRIDGLDFSLRGVHNRAQVSGTSDQKNLVDEIHSLQEKMTMFTKDIRHLELMKKEISQMKHGSVVLAEQITTVSKLRIYNPKYYRDVLSGIKVSPTVLDAIDQEIQQLYIGPNKLK